MTPGCIRSTHCRQSCASTGFLPIRCAVVFAAAAPLTRRATAFPDNWTIGTSFYHNVFAREHNLFIEAFRR